MIPTQLRRLAQMLMLLALQVLVLKHMSFWGMGTPMTGVLLLAYMPANTSRTCALLWGFAMGLATDIFSGTPGMDSAAMTLTAMLRPALLDMQAPKDAPEDMVPTYRSMGTWNHVRYVLTLFLTHHTAYFLLECFSATHLGLAAMHLLASLATSLLLAFPLEAIRNPSK